MSKSSQHSSTLTSSLSLYLLLLGFFIILSSSSDFSHANKDRVLQSLNKNFIASSLNAKQELDVVAFGKEKSQGVSSLVILKNFINKLYDRDVTFTKGYYVKDFAFYIPKDVFFRDTLRLQALFYGILRFLSLNKRYEIEIDFPQRNNFSLLDYKNFLKEYGFMEERLLLSMGDHRTEDVFVTLRFIGG